MNECRKGSKLVAEHGDQLTFVRVIIANGSEQIRQRCDTCGDILGRTFRRDRFTRFQLEAMVVADDRTQTNPPCVRCGTFGTEEHHWAPRSIFGEEAYMWPTAWLCPNCHHRWHQTCRVAV